MLFIQAARGLPRLRAPGIVPCIISFFTQLHCFPWDLTNRFTANIATYGGESWTLKKNEETRLDAFEMKGLRKILRVSWTAKKTNE